VQRRELLKAVGMVGVLLPLRPRSETSLGFLDLSELEIIDVHIHPPSPVLPSAA